MNTHIMEVSCSLSLAGVMEALKKVNALEASDLKKTVDFVELQYAPKADLIEVAEFVALKLLKSGVGVKLSIHWPFKGTPAWALQTDRTRVVNEGM